MKKYIIVEGDANDGDYITSKSIITDDKIEKLKVALSKIGSGRIPWTTGDQAYGNKSPEVVYKDILSGEEIELVQEFVPYGEYGIHTIESIEILEVINEYKL